MFSKPFQIISAFLLVAILFSFLSPVLAQEPTPTPGNRPITSYELFWPIVAGKVPGDSLYFLKTLKEKISLLLTPSTAKKSEQYLTLSKKRLVEGEKLLLEKKDYSLATQTINLSASHLDQATALAKDLPSSQQNSELRQTIIREGENETFFLNLLIQKIPQDQQSSLKNSLTQMEQSLSRLKTS